VNRQEEDERLRASLPLRQTALLRSAIGHTLVDIERLLLPTLADHLAAGRDANVFFTRSHGATGLHFSGGLVHSIYGWPSQLSIIVDGLPIEAPEFDERHLLSATPSAPDWLRACLGQEVRDVVAYVYDDGVPSDEPREVGLTYRLASGFDLYVGTYLHGNMDTIELRPPTELSMDGVVRRVSMAALPATGGDGRR
jgi:hypothetical protein